MKNVKSLLYVLLTNIFSINVSAQISGTVFRDFNNNGTREAAAAYTEPMVPGIIVNAYNAADVLIASYTTTSGTGYPYVAPNYSIPATGSVYNGTPGSNTGFVGAAVNVRLEFIIPSSGSCLVNNAIDFSAKSGGTNVQFVAGGATNINYGINNPAEYVFNNTPFSGTYIYLAVQASGNPAGGGTAASQKTFVKFPYNRSGTTALLNPSEVLATNDQIGCTYGTAYSKYAKKVFVSAYMKRHAGFGPANGVFNNAPGAIYMIDPSKNSTTNAATYFTSLDALGIPTHNTTGTPAYGAGTSYNLSSSGSGVARTESIAYLGNGQGVIGSNTTRNLPADITTASNDPAAYGQVGMVSIGDIEMSDDGQYLFVTNLYDRKIYQLQLNSTTNPTAATVVTSWALPNPPLRSASGIAGAAITYSGANDNTAFYTGSRGWQRPFGLKFYKGKLYVGAVTTAEGASGVTTKDNNTGNPEYTDLWSYVWELTPASGFNTVPVLQFPLNFDRAVDADAVDETWNKWSNTLPVPTGAYSLGGYYGLPQPILAGIEFDIEGSMILGFRDRAGDQTGTDQAMMSGSGANEARTVEANGDILRAYKNPATCAFELEQNGKEGINSPKAATAGAGNTQGPGNGTGSNGEFYYQDGIEQFNGTASGQSLYHQNTGEGSLVLLPGNNQVVSTSMDPTNLWSSGVSWMNNTTGVNTKDYEIQAGSGIGDMGKSSGLGDMELLVDLPPIEIGNRVWNDANGDGIQNANETGLAGVEMELVNGLGVVIGTVTTNASGNYYFSSATGTSGPGITYGVNILPNTTYTVRVKGTVTAGNNISGNAGLGAANFITLSNITGTGRTDWSDNDGVNIGGVFQTTVTTGTFGQNDHNIDFGFAPVNTLSVKYESFTANKQNKQSVLSFVIANSAVGSIFTIERSITGTNFTAIGTITGTVATSYTYTDATPIQNAKNYYRIKEVDAQGIISYSEIRMLQYVKDIKISVYPVPAVSQVTISLSDALIQKDIVINLTNAQGQIVGSKRIAKADPNETLDISKFANGIYQLTISSNGQVKSTAKVVIAK